MKPPATMGIQSFLFSDPSPYILLESVHDILKYLKLEIIMIGEYAFLDRADISITTNDDLNKEKKQYYVNGLLVSGLLEELNNEDYHKVEKQFESVIETISGLIQKKLESQNLDTSHWVFVHEDNYGDIVIGFCKKSDSFVEYNDETGYLKLCS